MDDSPKRGGGSNQKKNQAEELFHGINPPFAIYYTQISSSSKRYVNRFARLMTAPLKKLISGHW